MARSTAASHPTSELTERGPKAPIEDSSSARRLAETAAGIVMAPFFVAQQSLPREQPAVYYAGVTAAALAGLIEWPVAAALSAAVWIARTKPPAPPARN